MHKTCKYYHTSEKGHTCPRGQPHYHQLRSPHCKKVKLLLQLPILYKGQIKHTLLCRESHTKSYMETIQLTLPAHCLQCTDSIKKKEHWRETRWEYIQQRHHLHHSSSSLASVHACTYRSLIVFQCLKHVSTVHPICNIKENEFLLVYWTIVVLDISTCCIYPSNIVILYAMF